MSLTTLIPSPFLFPVYTIRCDIAWYRHQRSHDIIFQRVPLTLDNCVLAVEVVNVGAECTVEPYPYAFDLTCIVVLAQQSVDWMWWRHVPGPEFGRLNGLLKKIFPACRRARFLESRR